MKTFSILIFSFLLLSVPSTAQKEKINDYQIWLEGLVDYPCGEKLDFYIDASYRKLFSDNKNWWRVMARPSLRWKALKWMELRGGIGVTYANLNVEDNLMEIRPWQGLAFMWPKTKFVNFSHLFRAEQQIFYNTSTWKHIYTNRFRYKLGARVKLTETRKQKYFFIPLSVEFFYRTDTELDKLLRNKGRYTIGLGYVFNQRITVDARYFIQRSRSDDLDFSISDQVIRLRFRYNIVRREEGETL